MLNNQEQEAPHTPVGQIQPPLQHPPVLRARHNFGVAEPNVARELFPAVDDNIYDEDLARRPANGPN